MVRPRAVAEVDWSAVLAQVELGMTAVDDYRAIPINRSAPPITLSV
jgi:hypothetical protein